MYVHGHEDMTTCERSAWDQKLWVVSAFEAHTTQNTAGIHQIGLIDQLGD